MPKPNQNFTMKEMKDYIRQKKINHPNVKLSMKRADMIAGLKKAGHWEEKDKVKKTRKKPAPKPVSKPTSNTSYIASVNNILKLADENMKKKIEDGVKKRGPRRFALVSYNVEQGDKITNIKIFNSNDYSKFWRVKGKTSSIKKFDDEQLENSSFSGEKPIKIKGFIMGNDYKHLKSWSIDKGIPHMIDERPSWWGQ